MIFVNHELIFNSVPHLVRDMLAIINDSWRHRNDNIAQPDPGLLQSSYFGKKCLRR